MTLIFYSVKHTASNVDEYTWYILRLSWLFYRCGLFCLVGYFNVLVSGVLLTPFFSICCHKDPVDDRGTERESKRFNGLLHWLLTDENATAYTNSWKILSSESQCQNANICLVGSPKIIEEKIREAQAEQLGVGFCLFVLFFWNLLLGSKKR